MDDIGIDLTRYSAFDWIVVCVIWEYMLRLVLSVKRTDSVVVAVGTALLLLLSMDFKVWW